MSRGQYAHYVLSRLAEALIVASAAGLLVFALQRAAFLRPAHLPAGWPTGRLAGLREALDAVLGWLWPGLAAFGGHLLAGPKQDRPVYRRYPGAMYAYAGVRVDRSAGCRGGCVTGATGSGKTLACILPRLHSLCVHEAGAEAGGWRGSSSSRPGTGACGTIGPQARQSATAWLRLRRRYGRKRTPPASWNLKPPAFGRLGRAWTASFPRPPTACDSGVTGCLHGAAWSAARRATSGGPWTPCSATMDGPRTSASCTPGRRTRPRAGRPGCA